VNRRCKRSWSACGLRMFSSRAKTKDAEHFGGLREQVLQRDGYACRVCGDPDPGKPIIFDGIDLSDSLLGNPRKRDSMI
jgi:hypothetical protein